jgi:uncharacterized protein (DUF983 family)
MAPELISANQNCPSCGAALYTDFAYCPSCGEEISNHDESAASLEDQGLSEFIQSLNQHLSEAGSGAAESAFGLGCYIGFIPIAILVFILFLLGLRNWIVLALVGLVSVLVTTGIATLLSRRARAINVNTTYQREVEPQIETYVEKRSITRVEFDAVSQQVLTTNAPLLEFISSQRE